MHLKNTAYLMSVTLLVVAIIAIPVGVISAVKQYSIFDIIVTTLSFMGQAIPEFWLGLILILVFYVWLKNPITGDSLLPAGGMYTLGAEFSVLDWAKHLILPVTMGVVGWVTWYSRFSTLQHAGCHPPGLRPHGTRQRAAAEQSIFQACAAQCPPAVGDRYLPWIYRISLPDHCM